LDWCLHCQCRQCSDDWRVWRARFCDRSIFDRRCGWTYDVIRRRTIGTGAGPWRHGDIFRHRHADFDVFHQAKREASFTFQRGIGAARGQGENFDWPQDGDHPAYGIADGMSVAVDATFGIHSFMRCGNDFGGQRKNLSAVKNHAIELELHPSFADKVSGGFGVIKVTT